MNKCTLFKRETYTLTGVAMLFLFVSCIDGYQDDDVWSAGVENVTLGSPAVEDVIITPSADGSKLTIEWPVVMGAGGYEFSLYIVDDPDNPVVVGEEKQILDGCTVEREMREDTYYKIVIRTLGNEKYNNKEAETATEIAYNNLLPVTAIIPNGTNLTEYFAADPIPESSTELCYELEAGGKYTMDGNIPIGMTSVTFRGNKVNHANLTITNGSFLNSGAGLVLKFMDIDCSSFDGDVTSNAIMLMDSNFDETAAASLSSNGYIVIPTTSPVAIQSCEIKGLKQYLFYDNGKKYAIGTFLIKDCIIGQNTSTFNQATIRFRSGMVKDLTMIGSTFYNEVVGHSSNRICQISSGHVGSVRPTMEVWANGSMTITHSTFYQFPKGAQSFNSNGAMGQSTDKVTLQNCIIVDSGEEGGFVRRLRRGNKTAIFTAGNNSYWYNGAFPSGEISSGRDESGTHIETDPQLTYNGNGQFTLNGAEQISKRVGDPRWLPVE
ncbi:DUF4992 family lipoprotein [Proteiniphilum sp. X52]|uniref:DUF4992 family lipoprotein n=1 Tax=Proteiniphilum sp. X52 TaxID=2382159 RepID=UPI000F0A0939|nr:DUF4992 family lipoprotein [Proteiniphilum sp. X52]RNC66726.1 DUF4957 domain-containing protein [Proteiniphilum sp. X52]